MLKARALAGLALGAVLVSCAGPASKVDVTTVTSSPVADTPPVESSGELRMPLSAYTATDEEWAFVDRGYVLLLNRCMGNRGFAARAVVPETRSKPVPSQWRYGVVDPAVVARYGYHTPPEYRDRGNAGRAEVERRYAQNPMSDTELRVHNECVDEVQRQLGKPEGGSHMDDVLAQTLGVASFEQSGADRRVRAAMEEWANCMHGRGHVVSDPLVVMEGFDLTTELPTPAEVEVATADVGCKRESNLVGVWYAVEVAYQNSLIRDNIQRLEEGRRSVDTAVRVSAEVLGVVAPR